MPIRRMLRLLAPCIFVLGLIAPVQAQKTTAIEVVDATVRVPLPGKNLTSAYFLLRNGSDEPITLTGVEAAFAQRAEVHSHQMVDGMMRMRPVESVTVPAQGTLRFQSGGHHVMLFELDRRPRTGDPLHLTLIFEGGVEVPVKAFAVSVFDRPHH